MADQKISELTNIGESGVSIDYLPIVDKSASQTKRIQISSLMYSGVTNMIKTLSGVSIDMIPMLDQSGTTMRKIAIKHLDGIYAAPARNPLAFAQGIYLTAGTSGGGIAVADNDNIDFGTGDFTLALDVSVPNWLSVSYTNFFYSVNGISFAINNTSNGILRIARGATIGLSTVGTGFVAWAKAKICVVLSGDTALFYVNGIKLGDTIDLVATDVTVATPLYLMSDTAKRMECVIHSAITFNRALTAAQVLALYRNGVDFSDVGGSQTAKNVTTAENGIVQASRHFSTSFTGASATAFNGTDDTDNAAAYFPVTVVAGKRYRVSCTAPTISNGLNTYWFTKNDKDIGTASVQTITSTASSEGLWSYEFTATGSATYFGLGFTRTSATLDVAFSGFLLVEIGATLNLQPEGMQPAPGQWLDSSGNKLHALMPAAGATLTRQKIDPCWMMFDTGTVDQFVHFLTTGGAAPGTTRAIFPSGNYWIDEIYLWSAGTPTLTIGDDAATAATVVASTTLVASTWTKVPLLKNSTDHDDLFIDFTAGGAVTKIKIKYHLIETTS